MTDTELLQQFVDVESEEAFRRLVERHQTLVYNTCLRGLNGDVGLAEDAAQAVFIVLARKAKRIRNRKGLARWLFRTANYVVAHMRREEARRKRREAVAVELAQVQETQFEVSWWTGMEHHINEAVSGLGRRYQEAVVLHFLQGKPQRAVAEELGCSEAAVSMRISRAVRRMRALLAKRGVTVSVVALAAYLTEETAQAAAAGLTGSCHAAGMAALGGSLVSAGASGLVAKGVLRMLTWTKIKYAAAAVCALAAVTVGAGAAIQAARAPYEGLLIDDFETLDGWKTGAQKEASFRQSRQWVKRGRHALNFRVAVDHHDAETVGAKKYPMGWPSVRKQYSQPIDLSGYDFVEFDVYFTSSLRKDPDFALNVTLKDGDGRHIYGTCLTDLRQGRWSHEQLCIRGLPWAAGFQNLSFWLSESSYDHGEVADFFIDNVRATQAGHYRPASPEPVRRLLKETETAILWLEGPTTKIQASEEVSFSGAADPVVRLAAARNEREAVQVVLRPRAAPGLGEVTVELSDLRGPGNAVIPAAHLSWSPVGYVPVEKYGPEGWPDPLPGPRAFAADQARHYPIWLEVHVPPDTPAGDYQGGVRIRAQREELTVPLVVHVWDFDVPVYQHARTTVFIYGPWKWHEEVSACFGNIAYGQFADDWRPRLIEMLAAYRFSPHHFTDPIPLKLQDNRIVLGATAEFERRMARTRELGLRRNMMPVPYRFDRPTFMNAKMGSPEYFARVTEAYRVIAQYLRGKGWFEDYLVYPADEVVCHKHTRKDLDIDMLNRVYAAIRAADPDIRLFGAETPSPVLRGMNTWCMNINSFNMNVLREQRKLGNGAWWYNGYGSPRPGAGLTVRGVDHRVLFWMQWKYGIDGYLLWTMNRWSGGDPYKKPHQAAMLYPNADGTVSPSIRLAMMRDGLEDYEYHWLLERAAEQAQRKGRFLLARECRQALEQADSFILSFDNCAHIEPGHIYAARRVLAAQIEKANAVLRQADPTWHLAEGQ
ncbi:MAG: sigma-70 family RNA polymerase sigma factor [Kiritimatiellae bacterium]|nr:sigma-70 family RNA polymerase sigma factor [Kiritimatiellia bacterium]